MCGVLKKIFFVVSIFAAFALAKNDAVVRSSDFEAVQNELMELKKTHVHQRELDELWEQSHIIAEMNDRCANISLTDVIDPECSSFYRNELPQFEEDFMRITGEIRLGVISTDIGGLQQRAANLKVCSDALSQFFIGSEQLIEFKMNNELGLEPLNNDCSEIEVSYDFTLAYDKRRLSTIKNLAEIWVSKCGEIVLNPDKDGLAPLFKKNMTEMNDSIADKTDIDARLVIIGYKVYFATADRKHGSYMLGGETLFTSDKNLGAYLVIDLDPRHGRTVENNAVPQNYKGTKEVHVNYSGYRFESLEGRMVWGSGKKAVAKKGGPSRKDDDSSLKVRFSSMFGFDGSSDGEVKSATIEEEPALGGDSVTFFHGYIAAQLNMDIGHFSLGLGVGLAWGTVSAIELNDYGGKKGETDVRNSTVAMFNVDASYISRFEVENKKSALDSMTYAFGVRASYMADGRWPSLYIAPYFELGFIGMELGMHQAENFWTNIYVGLYLRFPTKTLWYSMRGL